MAYMTLDGLRVVGSLEPDPDLVQTMQEREKTPGTPVTWEKVRQNLGL